MESVRPRVPTWDAGGGGRVYPLEADDYVASSGSGKTWEESCSPGNGDSMWPWVPPKVELQNSIRENAETPLVTNPLFPVSHFVRVPHVRQVANWDCGLACVLMVLRAMGRRGLKLMDLHHLVGTTSIWTVDLAHLLRHFSLPVFFLTITLGANPSFALDSFYKDTMDEDEKRVNRLFEDAERKGIGIQRRSLTGDELCHCILSRNFLAIVLVDKRKLSHPWTDMVCLSGCCGFHPGYTGHYIVINGYDQKMGEFEVQDPASPTDSLRISLKVLQEARKTFGTDEDLLLVCLRGAQVATRTRSDECWKYHKGWGEKSEAQEGCGVLFDATCKDAWGILTNL